MRATKAWGRNMAVLLLAPALVLSACSGADADPPASTEPADTAEEAVALHLDEIQVVGTHNSFHLQGEPEELALLADMDPVQTAQRKYSHAPLSYQLNRQQVRQLELDVFADDQGGRYADPALRRAAGLGPYDLPEMREPGTKVLHEQDVDYHAVCRTLVRCLEEVKRWSDANPGHVPITVAIQFKDGPLIFPVPDQVEPEPWTVERMRGMDLEILSVFPRERILTPAEVQGDAATLEEAVRTRGWPTVEESRGKVMFTMVNANPYSDRYVDGRTDLAGLVLFPNAEPGTANAAVVSVDDPLEHGDRIRALVAEGYLVRTRADAAGIEARTRNQARAEAALASGAHWVVTDYPGPKGASDEMNSDYVLELPGFRVARCNPVTAPEGCRDEGIEPLGT